MTPRPPASPDFTGRTALVIGLARSGEAAARLLLRHGARVRVADRKARSGLGPAAAELEALGVTILAGDPGAEALDGVDLVVLSPGVPRSAPLPAAALARSLPPHGQLELIGELELAARFAKARIAAVTGTNGKSTTVTLIGRLLASLGIPCVVCGNVGLALAAVVEDVPAEGVLVVEVSSFQLESVDEFRPDVGVVLNLTPDHLDRYPSVDAYYAAKANLFARQAADDAAVLNGDDARLMRWAPALAARLFTFGEGAVETGATVAGGDLVVRQNGRDRRVIRTDELGIPGPHNRANALAALATLMALGLDAAAPEVAEALRRFPGLEHRIEYSGTLNGVRFYNDSKATNTDSLAVALRSFHEPIVLIAGGRDKKGDFAGLRDGVRGRVAAVVTIGEAAPTIRAAWDGVVTNWVEAGRSFERAVEAAYQEATAHGGSVLLSPGCASFDMFQDYEDRGRRFKTLVSALGAEMRGQ